MYNIQNKLLQNTTVQFFCFLKHLNSFLLLFYFVFS